MTLVAALSGCDGTILFADTEEVVGSYSTRNVEKSAVMEFKGFRVGIAGATTDATYADTLQSEILEALSKLTSFDEAAIRATLASTLTDFYSRHVWPRIADKPQMEYLLAVQPLPHGLPRVIHISETAANIVPDEGYKTIGVGRYLADYIFKQIFPAPIPFNRRESISFLCSAGLYVAKEVRENVDGVGPVQRVSVFASDGKFDELYFGEIMNLEETLSGISELLGYCYADMMDAERETAMAQEDPYADGWVLETRRGVIEWYAKWKKDVETRKRLRAMETRKAGSGA